MLFRHFFTIVLFIAILAIPLAHTQIYQKAIMTLILLSGFYIILFKKSYSFSDILLLYKDVIILTTILICCMIISMIANRIVSSYSWDGVYQAAFTHFFGFIALLFFYKEGFFGKAGKNLIFFFLLISLSIELAIGFGQIFFQFNFIKGVFGSLQSGLTGTTINRNIFGFYMAFGTILTLFAVISSREILKTHYLILLTLFFVGLLFSYSRSSWLFVFVFTLSCTVVFFKQIRKRDISLLLFIISLFAIPLLFSHSLGDRFMSIMEGDSSNRFEIWQTTLSLINEKLFLGHGVRNFNFEATGAYFPHNFILDILYSMGILGFCVSIALLILTCKEIIKTNLLYLPLFFALFAAMQFDHDITSRRVLSMLMLFAFFVFSKRIDKQSIKNQQKM
jgi:O-antigen ligase